MISRIRKMSSRILAIIVGLILGWIAAGYLRK